MDIKFNCFIVLFHLSSLIDNALYKKEAGHARLHYECLFVSLKIIQLFVCFMTSYP